MRMLTTKEFMNRYDASHGSIHIWKKQGRLPADAYTPGNGGSDGTLYDQEKCDQLALDGKFHNRALKRIKERKRGESEKR